MALMQGARASLQPHMSTSNKSIRHKGFVAFEMPSSTAVSGQKSRDRHMPSMRRGQWCCAEKEQSSDTKLADDDDLPPWLRKEKLQKLQESAGGNVPFGVWLLGSVLVAIAAVGSIFELLNQNPIFGVVGPDSPLYTPILGLFSVTGLPTAGFLFLKGVQGANQMSEQMDKIDGR